MPQLSLYLDEPTHAMIKENAAKAGTSLSKYAQRLIREDRSSKWPDSFFDLYGSIKDDTFIAPEDMDWSADTRHIEW